MSNKILSIVTAILHENRRFKIWMIFVSVIAVILAVVIMYASMPLAVAFQSDVYCGLDEHEHTKDCYTTTLICELDEDEEHTHTEDCYEKNLTCGKEEHKHDSTCYIDTQEEAEAEVKVEADAEAEVVEEEEPLATDEEDSSTNYGNSVVNVYVSKFWDDDEDHTNDSVIVHLLGEDGSYLDDEYGTKELSEENGWTEVWENLPDAVYSIEEDEIDGYTSNIEATKDTGLSIFIPVDSSEIDDSGAYLIGSKNSDTEYNLWQMEEIDSPIVTKTYTLNTDTPICVGGNEYLQYYYDEDIPDEAKWYFNECNNLTSEKYSGDYPYYKINNASNFRNLVQSSSSTYKYNLYVSSSLVKYIAIDNQYMAVLQSYTGGIYKPVYIYDSGGNVLRGASSTSTTKTEYYFFKNVKETNYYFDITNTPVEEETTDNIEYTKTIDALRDNQDNPDTDIDDDNETDLTDLYRLYLNLEQLESSEDKGVDLLVVIDESSSMSQLTTYQGEKIGRDEVVTRILNGSTEESTEDGLISKFLSLNEKNQIGFVTFGGHPDYTGDYNYTVDTTDDNLSEISGAWFDSSFETPFVQIDAPTGNGTNYCAGFLSAEDMFNDLEDDGNKKVMVFISDGAPTYYTNEDGSQRTGTGVSQSACVKQYIDKTIDAFNSFNSLYPEVTTYTVGFGIEEVDSQGMESKQEILRYMAKLSGGEFVEADDGDSLIPALEKYIIAYNKDGTYNNVSIVDELSKYVTIAEQADYKVTMTTDSGEVYTLWQKEIDDNGNYVYKATEEGEGIIKNVSFDSDTSMVKVEFYPEYYLEVGTLYELSFNVETSDYAYALVNRNRAMGYETYTDEKGNAHSGDKNTDYANNETSSLKPGFYSNNIAYISCLKNSKSAKYEYDYPVIQALKDKTYSLPATGGIGLVNYYILTVSITICAMICTIVFTKRRKIRGH